jgi:helicase
MRASLAKWISDADALRHLEYFRVTDTALDISYIRNRSDDYYTALVGELFDRMRDGYDNPTDWARLGNAFAQYAARDYEGFRTGGVSVSEANLFAAAAFYLGGFPASAYITLKGRTPVIEGESWRACFDLLAHPLQVRSETMRSLLNALASGDTNFIAQTVSGQTDREEEALPRGPNDWIPARLLHKLLLRFEATNIRAVLPNGGTEFWTPLILSFLGRTPPAWEFFPSQIHAIRSGLLERAESFSLQMPTGAGKTALTETLLYWHLKQDPTRVAILLVPYRSLASELRTTLVKRLNSMDISAWCAYGGTVPSGDEVHSLDETQALVATPESLSGLLSADPAFLQRVSLVICDEGHLLDGGSRGVSLELLLARMKARDVGQPRFVFVSAIVPNIEDINSWLGGTPDTVVRSDYRPALAEFAVLSAAGSGATMSIKLRMHPQESPPASFDIDGFLTRNDFRWTNSETGRVRTFPYTSVKTQAVAAARKALSMGGVAVFAANKRGQQGVVGLAEELLDQLRHPLQLPVPLTYANSARVDSASEYLRLEYGPDWLGTKAIESGAILHHGDVPQETREVIEGLLRGEHVRLAFCTSTLAEGVNLPIRTLVLYSVRRMQMGGRPESMLARDIKNLVGRAGRAGATTKGLVICANEGQWPVVEPVARQAAGEPVIGALRSLIDRLRQALAVHNTILTNPILEAELQLHTLIDGIDATLVDLAAEEIGEEQLARLAVQLADQTFAAQQADEPSKRILRTVFELRARRVAAMHAAGRLGWVRETGARLRMIDVVEADLLPQRQTWDEISTPTDPELVTVIMSWAWKQRGLRRAVQDSYRLQNETEIEQIQQSFFDTVNLWLSGSTFYEMATQSRVSMDDMLGLYTRVIAYELQTVIEQGISLLKKLLESQGKILAPAVEALPDHMRFGVPTVAARVLAAGGLRHRRAAVVLGGSEALREISSDDRLVVFISAQDVLRQNQESYRSIFGSLVLENTHQDLAAVTGDDAR